MITFASEHIYASLEVVVIEDGLDILEIKLGILQVCSFILTFIHFN